MFICNKIYFNIWNYICDPGQQKGHKGQFFTSSESWMNNLSTDVWVVRIGWDTAIWKSGIWGSKINLNIEKITFKVVQMKFLAKHITNQKLTFDIFTVGNIQNIFMEHDLYLIS